MQVRMSSKYFVCKSVNVLSKLMQKGFFPSCTKQSEYYNKIWLWYFDTTPELIEELKNIFEGYEVLVVD